MTNSHQSLLDRIKIASEFRSEIITYFELLIQQHKRPKVSAFYIHFYLSTFILFATERYLLKNILRTVFDQQRTMSKALNLDKLALLKVHNYEAYQVLSKDLHRLLVKEGQDYLKLLNNLEKTRPSFVLNNLISKYTPLYSEKFES